MRYGRCYARFQRNSRTATREVNRFLPSLATAIYAIMQDQDVDISYNSRVEHIATGGVAKYPDIVNDEP